MRVFLAVELPDKIKQELNDQLTEFKKLYPGFDWVSPENFHVTVHFFGEVNTVDKIVKKIKDLLWDQQGFILYSLVPDVFVNHKLTVYLNFRREKKIEELAEKIKSNFDGNQVNDRKFVPHLTLARGRRSSKQQYFALKNRLQKLDIDISFPVKKIVLFESILEGRKPVYKKLESFKLIND